MIKNIRDSRKYISKLAISTLNFFSVGFIFSEKPLNSLPILNIYRWMFKLKFTSKEATIK